MGSPNHRELGTVKRYGFLFLLLIASPLYAAGQFDSHTVFGPTPVMGFHFNERTGTNLNSSIVDGGSGTLTNSVWVQGKFGPGIDFPAVTGAGVVVTPGASVFPVGTESFSASLWFKNTNTTQVSKPLIIFGNVAGTVAYFDLRIITGGRIRTSYSDTRRYLHDCCKVSTGAWNFIYVQEWPSPNIERVVVWDGKTVQRSSDVIHTGLNNTNTSAKYEIGGDPLGNPDDVCGCSLDDVQLWKGNDYGRVLRSFFNGIDAGH